LTLALVLDIDVEVGELLFTGGRR